MDGQSPLGYFRQTLGPHVLRATNEHERESLRMARLADEGQAIIATTVSQAILGPLFGNLAILTRMEGIGDCLFTSISTCVMHISAGLAAMASSKTKAVTPISNVMVSIGEVTDITISTTDLPLDEAPTISKDCLPPSQIVPFSGIAVYMGRLLATNASRLSVTA